jgi:hypothetical protein
MSSGFDSHRSSTSSGSTGDSLDDVPLTLQDSDSEQDRPRAGNRLAAPVAGLTLQNAAGTGPSGVPKLSLASIPNPSLSMATTRRQHADYPTAPHTHRGPPPSLPLPPQGRPVPKLSLASAAGPAAAASGPSSGLIPSGRHASSPAFHRSSPSHAEDASSTHTVQVSLLSTAFSWSSDMAAGSSNDDISSRFDQLQARCSSALGIAPSQLDLYELRRLDAASFTAAAGQKVAFAVQGNRERPRLLLCMPPPPPCCPAVHLAKHMQAFAAHAGSCAPVPGAHLSTSHRANRSPAPGASISLHLVRACQPSGGAATSVH